MEIALAVAALLGGILSHSPGVTLNLQIASHRPRDPAKKKKKASLNSQTLPKQCDILWESRRQKQWKIMSASLWVTLMDSIIHSSQIISDTGDKKRSIKNNFLFQWTYHLMGESDCRSNKQRNKISRVIDAKRGTNRVLWHMVMGGEDMGTERENSRKKKNFSSLVYTRRMWLRPIKQAREVGGISRLPLLTSFTSSRFCGFYPSPSFLLKDFSIFSTLGNSLNCLFWSFNHSCLYYIAQSSNYHPFSLAYFLWILFF